MTMNSLASSMHIHEISNIRNINNLNSIINYFLTHSIILDHHLTDVIAQRYFFNAIGLHMYENHYSRIFMNINEKKKQRVLGHQQYEKRMSAYLQKCAHLSRKLL